MMWGFSALMCIALNMGVTSCEGDNPEIPDVTSYSVSGTVLDETGRRSKLLNPVVKLYDDAEYKDSIQMYTFSKDTSDIDYHFRVKVDKLPHTFYVKVEAPGYYEQRSAVTLNDLSCEGICDFNLVAQSKIIYNISGTVKNLKGESVSDAMVYLSDGVDSQREAVKKDVYRFDTVINHNKPVKIKVVAPGYVPDSINLVLLDIDRDYVCDFRLKTVVDDVLEKAKDDNLDTDKDKFQPSGDGYYIAALKTKVFVGGNDKASLKILVKVPAPENTTLEEVLGGGALKVSCVYPTPQDFDTVVSSVNRVLPFIGLKIEKNGKALAQNVEFDVYADPMYAENAVVRKNDADIKSKAKNDILVFESKEGTVNLCYPCVVETIRERYEIANDSIRMDSVAYTDDKGVVIGDRYEQVRAQFSCTYFTGDSLYKCTSLNDSIVLRNGEHVTNVLHALLIDYQARLYSKASSSICYVDSLYNSNKLVPKKWQFRYSAYQEHVQQTIKPQNSAFDFIMTVFDRWDKNDFNIITIFEEITEANGPGEKNWVDKLNKPNE